MQSHRTSVRQEHAARARASSFPATVLENLLQQTKSASPSQQFAAAKARSRRHHLRALATHDKPANTLKAIEAVEVGDFVWAWNDSTESLDRRRVTRLFHRKARAVLTVTCQGNKGVQDIGATTEHPFWVQGKGWTAASQLVAGDSLQSLRTGQALSVRSAVDSGGRADVFNFEVEGVHNYFVGIDGILVHNESSRATRNSDPLPRFPYDFGPEHDPLPRFPYDFGGDHMPLPSLPYDFAANTPAFMPPNLGISASPLTGGSIEMPVAIGKIAMGFRAYERKTDRLISDQRSVPGIGEYACAPTAMGSILQEKGIHASIPDLAQQVGTQNGVGSHGRPIVETLRQRGISNARWEANLTRQQLMDATADGHAALVAVKNAKGGGHVLLLDSVLVSPFLPNQEPIYSVRDPYGGLAYHVPETPFMNQFTGWALLTNPLDQ